MKSTKALLVLATLLLGGIMVACAPSTPVATPEPEVTEEMTEAAAPTEEPTPGPEEKVVINWWHISTVEKDMAMWQELADAYMAENPNVQIEITVLENDAFKTRLTTAMQAGDPPDLFQSWGGGVLYAYSEAGLVRNINPELEGEWRDSIAAQSALNLYCDDNGCYGVPWNWGAVGMFYNKEAFTTAGLDPENPPATWTEFLDAVDKLQAAGITPIALGEKEKWPGHFWWVYLAIRNGGKDAFEAAYNRTGSFADEPFVKAGQDLQQLIDRNPFPEGYLGFAYGDQAGYMGNGKAGMELMGQWAPNVQKDNSESGEGLGDKLGWFPFPAVEGGAGGPTDVLGGGDGFAVGANAPDETVDFLKFLVSVESQRKMVEAGIITTPTVKGTEDLITDPIAAAILDARNNAEYFQLYYDQYLPPAVGEAVNDAVETLFAGVGTPEEAAQMIEDAAAQEIK
jgi:raffinose/stachyose/melibiose transport system substrate-binding protein